MSTSHPMGSGRGFDFTQMIHDITVLCSLWIFDVHGDVIFMF